MAFDRAFLTSIGGTADGRTRWKYSHPSDLLSAILGDIAYFDGANDIIKNGDTLVLDCLDAKAETNITSTLTTGEIRFDQTPFDEAGIGAGGSVNLTPTQNASDVTIAPSGGGAAAVITAATAAMAGVMSPAQALQLANLGTAASRNVGLTPGNLVELDGLGLLPAAIVPTAGGGVNGAALTPIARTDIDATADFILVWDASAAELKSIRPSTLFDQEVSRPGTNFAIDSTVRPGTTFAPTGGSVCTINAMRAGQIVAFRNTSGVSYSFSSGAGVTLVGATNVADARAASVEAITATDVFITAEA